MCVELGGTCKTTRDGYYWISSVCIALGGIVLYLYVQPAGLRLQGESFCLSTAWGRADVSLVQRCRCLRGG